MHSPLVFITGASSGIGQALALRFYQAGYRLALLARREPAIQEWIQAQQLDTKRITMFAVDVSDTDALIAAAQHCIHAHGVPDVVIANAGISVGMDSAQREDLDVMQRIFAVNNIGLAATFHPFITPMCQRGHGTLVGIASVAGLRGLPGHGAYCTSKAAVIAYCESLRGELAAQGVRVVTLSPGYIDTPLTQKNRYRMPFLMQPEAFADKAFHAIQQQVSYQTIPRVMGVLGLVWRNLPHRLLDRLLRNRPRKHRDPSVR